EDEVVRKCEVWRCGVVDGGSGGLPGGGNSGANRRRARQARRYRGRRLPDLGGQIQGRAGAVERGSPSADGGRTARAVPAGADAAHRDDAVARGRRGGGLRGIPTMHRVTAALASASLLALIAAPGERAAAEEPYPSKPIRFVLPQPAGGAVDLIARALGDRLSYAMRQPVIVENQPGANGGLAAGQGSPAPRPTATPCSWPSTPISWSTQI